MSKYLEDLIDNQQVDPTSLQSLRNARDNLETILRGSWKTGDPNFYYGGSYAKGTMIKDKFDLDLVVYFPPCNFTVQALYEAIEARLQSNNLVTRRHNVAIRLPYEGGFHIDVVPGRAIKNDFIYANLWASEKATTKQTSIKIHIKSIRGNSRKQKVVKLLKLWNLRQNLNVSSFVFELIVQSSLSGRYVSLENDLLTILQFIANNIKTCRLVDPANSNNVVSDELAYGVKVSLETAATAALNAQYWSHVIW